jgi:hypothetical protein
MQRVNYLQLDLDTVQTWLAVRSSCLVEEELKILLMTVILLIQKAILGLNCKLLEKFQVNFYEHEVIYVIQNRVIRTEAK